MPPALSRDCGTEEARRHVVWLIAALGARQKKRIVSASFKIEISDEPTPEVVHRFRNFGEDIFRNLEKCCSVSIEEIDRATTSFVIRDVRKHDRAFIEATVKRELRQHHFDETGTCTRVPNT